MSNLPDAGSMTCVLSHQSFILLMNEGPPIIDPDVGPMSKRSRRSNLVAPYELVSLLVSFFTNANRSPKDPVVVIHSLALVVGVLANAAVCSLTFFRNRHPSCENQNFMSMACRILSSPLIVYIVTPPPSMPTTA
eukprot:scaffold76255_cov56-Attheya_sp.AAC.1